MRHADRFRLVGTYRTPKVRIGSVLSCEARDCDVIVTGHSDARIPWPVGQPRARGGRPGLVVFGGLAVAVRHESSRAVCHWFGVGAATMARWRTALGVAGLTAESARLRWAWPATRAGGGRWRRPTSASRGRRTSSGR
jgi:hypothetical protein